jgi:rubrerythrin
MAKSVKGTKTERDLLKAFAGESQARKRYTYFAGTARKHPQSYYEVLAENF